MSQDLKASKVPLSYLIAIKLNPEDCKTIEFLTFVMYKLGILQKQFVWICVCFMHSNKTTIHLEHLNIQKSIVPFALLCDLHKSMDPSFMFHESVMKVLSLECVA